MGERIKRLRQAKGITQEELAKVVGLQRAAIAKYEIGIVENMKQTTIKKIADYLNVKPSYLMCLEDKTDELEEEAATAGWLVTKLFNLAEQSNITAAAQEEMKAIISRLNTEYKGLNLTYDDVISKTATTKEALESYLETLYVARRGFWTEETTPHPDECQLFWDHLRGVDAA